MRMFNMRVELVADDDADANLRIPKDVLDALGPDTILVGRQMMYIRRANWEKLKHRFPAQPPR